MLVAVIFVVTLMVTVIFSRDRSSLESASSKKSERTSLKYALHVITGNDQLKVYIGVVLAYNLVVPAGRRHGAVLLQVRHHG